MDFELMLTPEQVVRLGAWVEPGVNMAPVLLRLDRADGRLYVGQGDSRAVIDMEGDFETID